MVDDITNFAGVGYLSHDLPIESHLWTFSELPQQGGKTPENNILSTGTMRAAKWPCLSCDCGITRGSCCISLANIGREGRFHEGTRIEQMKTDEKMMNNDETMIKLLKFIERWWSMMKLTEARRTHWNSLKLRRKFRSLRLASDDLDAWRDVFFGTQICTEFELLDTWHILAFDGSHVEILGTNGWNMVKQTRGDLSFRDASFSTLQTTLSFDGSHMWTYMEILGGNNGWNKNEVIWWFDILRYTYSNTITSHPHFKHSV